MNDLEATIRAIVRDELAKAAPAPAAVQVTIAAYARQRSISVSTVRAAIRDGRLPSVKVGRAVRIPANADISAPVHKAHVAAPSEVAARILRLVRGSG
jgi:excisionase family DNA binding protein